MSNKAAIFLAFALVVSSVSNRLLEMYDQYDLLPTILNGTTADSYGTVEYETNRFVGDSTRIIPRTVSGNVLGRFEIDRLRVRDTQGVWL